MKNRLVIGLGLILALLGFALPANAGTIVMPAIFGSGNTDFQNGTLQNDIVVGLQAKVRDTGAVNTTNGVDFYVPLGYSSNPARSAWNAEIAVATPNPLSQYSIYWWWDVDPAAASYTWLPVDLLAIPDNSYGQWTFTGNGQGVEDNNPAAHNFVGQSWNSLFFGIPVNTPGVYSFTVEVYSWDGPYPVPEVWNQVINVHVGEDMPSVPDTPATILLLGIAMAGLTIVHQSRRGERYHQTSSVV